MTTTNTPTRAAAEYLSHQLSFELRPLLAGLHFAAQAHQALRDLAEAADRLPPDSEYLQWLRSSMGPMPDAMTVEGPDSAAATVSSLAGLALAAAIKAIRDGGAEVVQPCDELGAGEGL